VGEAQIQRQRHDVDAERAALLQPLRQRRQRGGAARLAAASVKLHPGDNRPHLRQFDPRVMPEDKLCQSGRSACDRQRQTPSGTARSTSAGRSPSRPGFATNARPPPLRPRLPCRGPAREGLSARLGIWSRAGGRLELPEVFAGSPSLAINSATRAVNASTCDVNARTYVQSARISASFSACDRWSRSASWVTLSLNRGPRGHVKYSPTRSTAPYPTGR